MAGIPSFSQPARKAIKPNSFRAVHWTKEQGLSWNGMNSMIKDAKGFLWIGSQYGGFCRFDGATFKQYLPSTNSRHTINSDKIHSFIEDSLNNIWIATSKGLSRYDLRADTFTNFNFVDSLSSTFNIVPFASTREDILCLESRGMITAIGIRTLKKRMLVQLSGENAPVIHHNTNHSYFDEKTKSIWFLPVNKPGRLQQVFLDGRTAFYQWPCYRNNVRHRHSAEDIRFDRTRNSLWINSGDGLLEFSLADKIFLPVEAFKELIEQEKYDRGVGIEIDTDGRIWFSTFFDGIFIYDPQTKVLQPVISNTDVQRQAGDANLHIYYDRQGIAWTSNWLSHGIYEILPHNPPVTRFAANPQKKDSLSDQAIHSIIPAANGEVWIGTERGLNIFESKTGKFKILTQKELPGVRGELIFPVHIDTNKQKAWIASSSSANSNDLDLYEMDIETRKCKRILLRDGTRLLDTVSIMANFFWPYKKGLIFADERNGIFEIKENSLFAELVIPFNKRVSIGRMQLVDERFIFLQRAIETPNISFENKNGTWMQISHPLDTLESMSLFYNKDDQTYWVGFKYELVQYDNNFRPLKRYRQDDGYHGMAHEMLMDNDGNLWFSNNLNQINRLDTALGVITNIAENEGYQKQNRVWITPLAKDVNGNLYFGGIHYGSPSKNGGLDQVIPGRYSSAATSSVYLRSLTINQKPFPLDTGINNLFDLSLRYNQNTISIETGIIDYYANGKGHIRYKLKSNDIVEDWQYGPAYYTIRYEKLPPGKYELVLQASNAGNEFNSPEKIVRIYIRPPFWQTWWFRVLALLVAIAIIYSIIQYRSRSLKQRNKQLEVKVMARTRELKQSLEDLRATQSQLIQSEKMASLGELTAGIAHEIQNPLNFVNNFSEVNKDLLIEMKDEIEKGNLGEAKLIARDVIDNEEKINHHGKRAEAIVKGMLLHSRTSTGTREPTDINALTDEYLRLAFHGLKAKDKSFNAAMQTDYDERIGRISIIPQEIGRVLLNLINNAFYAVTDKRKQAGASYEPVVSVSTKKIMNSIEIRVKDNGTGIPQKVVDKIFQPFFTTKPTGQGTGLGLSLAYDIVKAHGGELKLETEEGQGTEFIIQLPV